MVDCKLEVASIVATAILEILYYLAQKSHHLLGSYFHLSLVRHRMEADISVNTVGQPEQLELVMDFTADHLATNLGPLCTNSGRNL